MAYRHVALIDLYLRTNFHSNRNTPQKNFVDRGTDGKLALICRGVDLMIITFNCWLIAVLTCMSSVTDKHHLMTESRLAAELLQ